MNRIDIKNRSRTPKSVENHIIASLEELTVKTDDKIDAIIVMDQVSEENCGVVTDAVRECLIRLGRERRPPLIYADSRERIGLFREMLIKCNDREALEQFGLYNGPTIAEDVLQQCGSELARRTGRMVFITRGSLGQLLFDPAQPDAKAVCVPAVPVEGEIDICGAGDATSAALVSALCAGATPQEAAMVGNLAASVTIRKIGQTGTASPDEVLATWDICVGHL
jgi:bifunctional ADP-heptose synthase (sugar kinase/adenylyltransferase)